MKKHLIFLLAALVLIFSSASALADPMPKKKDPFHMTKRMIEEELQPQFKINNVTEQRVIEPTIVTEPTTVLRIVMIGYPLKKLPGPKEAMKDREKPEYADLILVPVNSAFLPDKSLQFSLPSYTKGTEDYFFSQYGFEWRRMNTPLKHFTVYAGSNKECHVFASADLQFLLKMKSALMLRNGFSPVEYLTEALSVHDLDNVTAESASVTLPDYGNAALPYLQKEIRRMMELDESANPHFRVLVRINTPEACTLINQYVADNPSEDKVLLPIFDAISTCKWINPYLVPTYRVMFERQLVLPFLVEAYQKIGLQKE